MPLRIPISILIFFVGLTGCGSIRQIETASPRPANVSLDGAETAGLAVLGVNIETGNTILPDEIQALRFRIEEIRLRSEEGEWKDFPAEQNSFEVLPDRYLFKTVLSTRVQPIAYDAVALKISDVFVLFSENAGGPLTLPHDLPFEVKIDLIAEVGNANQINITIEPGASLFRDADCRWYFVPFWTSD